MTNPRSIAAGYSVLFFLATALAVVMLATDSNLRTDFGALSSGYYAHWDVVLVAGIATLLGGILLVLVRSRAAIRAGVIGSGLLALILVGDIFTYAQVGFATAWDFAQYLFGITYYGGDIRYLFDALLGVYVGTFFVGLALLVVTGRKGPPTVAPGMDASPAPEVPPP